MSEGQSGKAVPPYEDVTSAPVVYFDLAAANGIFSGAVQIELAHRILAPVPGTNDVIVKFATSGRLRCSPNAARALIDALNGALAMLEQAEQPVAAGSKLN